MFSYFKGQAVKSDDLAESIMTFEHCGSELQTDLFRCNNEGRVNSRNPTGRKTYDQV